MYIHQKATTNSRKRFITAAMWLLIMIFWIWGCGSSSDDTGSVTESGLAYTGSTRRAAINETNARILAGQALRGGRNGHAMDPLSASATGSANNPNSHRLPLALDLADILRTAVEDIDLNSESPALADTSSAARNTTVRRPGDCGGSSGHLVTVDESHGLFSGSLSFVSFCNHQVYLDGETSFSGNYNTNSGRPEWVALIFSNLVMTVDEHAYALDGELDWESDGTETTVTLDLLVRNDSGWVSWLNNCTIGTNANRYSLSGRYYDPDFGFVDFTTAEPLTIGTADPYPDSGAIAFTGSKGSAGGPTRARLQALSATHCRIQADTNGDGTYDYDSGSIPWSGL
jgi:hypothetical protein